MDVMFALLAIAIWLAVCAVSVRRPSTAPWPPVRGSLFAAAWAWGVTILLYFGLLGLALDHLPSNLWLWILSGGLSLAGSVLQGVAMVQVGVGRSSGWNTSEPHTSGLYARMRHPQYAGQALSFVGLAILTLDPLTMALCLASVVLLVIVGQTEDHVHKSRDGEAWASYLARVPGWWPHA